METKNSDQILIRLIFSLNDRVCKNILLQLIKENIILSESLFNILEKDNIISYYYEKQEVV